MENVMTHRNLGRSGLKVSRLCLGTMNFGGPTDRQEAARILGRARDDGVNFVDTADAYGSGLSEEIAGALIADNRDAWVLATKIANPMGEDANATGLSRKWIMRGAEHSLRRLKTDYIDVYYLHKEDHATPLAETVHAIADLVHQGKIRYFGVSNYRGWRVAEICRICDDLGIDRPVVSQPYYHALYRNVETEHLPACNHFGLGVVSYSPMARGVLTGKYDPDAAPDPQTRAGRSDKRMMQTEWHPDSLRTARKIRDYAEQRGTTAGAFAVAWVLNNPLITGVVAGPRTEAQWGDYAKALDYKWTADDEALIDGLVTSGHPVVAGYNDPAYPLEGRPTAGTQHPS
jgi:aryl-alcohol dehydrogenase-like predicted oxidoreductase